MKYITLVLVCFLNLCSISKAPFASINDNCVEAANIGQHLTFVELNTPKDTTFADLKNDDVYTSYVLAHRTTGETPDGTIRVKIFFSKKHRDYIWQVYRDMFSAAFTTQDTIQLKKNTWYRLSSEKYGFYTYFYWNGKPGEYITKVRPKTGAW
jgi:hypothetical protein